MHNQYNLNFLLSQAYKTHPLLTQINPLLLISTEPSSLEAVILKNRNLCALEPLASASTQKKLKVAAQPETLNQEFFPFLGTIQPSPSIDPLLLPMSEPYLKEKQAFNNLAQNIELYTRTMLQTQLFSKLSDDQSSLPDSKSYQQGQVSEPKSTRSEHIIKAEEPLVSKASLKTEKLPRQSPKAPTKKKSPKNQPLIPAVSHDADLIRTSVDGDTARPQDIKLEALIEVRELTDEALQPIECPVMEPPALTMLTKEFPDWDLGKIVEFVELGRGKNDLVKRPLRGAEDYEYEELYLQKEEEDESQNLTEEQKEEIYEEYLKKLKGLLGYNELDLEKVRKILVRKKYNLHKALIFVRKNLSFYKKFFCLKSAQI